MDGGIRVGILGQTPETGEHSRWVFVITAESQGKYLGQ